MFKVLVSPLDVAFPKSVTEEAPVGVPPIIRDVVAPAKFIVVATVLYRFCEVAVPKIVGALKVVVAAASFEPMVSVVAAFAKLTVVAVVFIKLKVDVPEIIAVLIVGELAVI